MPLFSVDKADQTQADLARKNLQDQNAKFAQALNQTNARAAPQNVQGATIDPNALAKAQAPQLGQAATVQASQMAAPQNVSAPNLGPAAAYGGAQIGAVGNVNAPTLGPAATVGTQSIAGAGADARTQQMAFVSALQNQMANPQNSIAQNQLRAGTDAALQSQMAMAASARGGNPALAQRQAAMNAAAIQGQGAQQSGMLAAQEQNQNQGVLAGALQGLRGQDIGLAQADAGLQQQGALANQAAQNQFGLAGAQMGMQAGLANQATQAGLAQAQAGLTQQAGLANVGAQNQFALAGGQMGLQADLANQQAGLQTGQVNAGLAQQAGLANAGAQNQFGLAGAQMGLQADLANQGATNTALGQNAAFGQQASLANQAAGLTAQGQKDAAQAAIYGNMTANATAQQQGAIAQMQTEQERQKANTAAKTSVIGAGLGALGSMFALPAMASDRNLKTDIKDGGKNVAAFLDALSAHGYKYKDDKWGKGEQTSVMAQDLEKTAMGKQMVIDTPEGKIVNYGKGFGAILAAQAELNRRLKDVESKRARMN